MVTPDTLTIWLKEQAWPIGIILGCILLAFLVIKISASRRHKALSREREGVTESTFAAPVFALVVAMVERLLSGAPLMTVIGAAALPARAWSRQLTLQ